MLQKHFKALNRKKNSNGMYQDGRNNSAPGIRTRKDRHSVSDDTNISTDPRLGIAYF